MTKLIFTHAWGGEPCSGITIIPFEYKGKDEFIYDVLERFNKKFFKQNNNAVLFGEYLTNIEIDDIESNTYTLDEWFTKNKETPFAL